MDLKKTVDAISRELEEKQPVVLMYSGGVESSFLLKILLENTIDFQIVTIDNGLIPSYQIDFIKQSLQKSGAEAVILSFDFKEIYAMKKNLPSRCYFCKRKMLSLARENFPNHTIIEGSSCYEEGERPGEMALTEMEIFSPLKKYCVDRTHIIKFLKKSAFPFMENNTCLATRFPLFSEPDVEKIKLIDRIESKIFHATGNPSRLRLSRDGNLTLEIKEEDLVKLPGILESNILEKIKIKLRKF